jgi:hypothetical protein
MIYDINPYETSQGFAIQLLVELQENFTTADRAMVYYHLRNSDNITVAFDIPANAYRQLPYSILRQEKLIITGFAFQELMSGAKTALDIVLKRRPDIVLRKRSVLLYDDCFGGEIGEFYLDNEDFSKASFIYADPDLTELFKYEGKISNNSYVGSYSPKSGLQEINPCK